MAIARLAAWSGRGQAGAFDVLSRMPVTPLSAALQLS